MNIIQFIAWRAIGSPSDNKIKIVPRNTRTPFRYYKNNKKMDQKNSQLGISSEQIEKARRLLYLLDEVTKRKSNSFAIQTN